jgi:hypothetical protein
MIMTSFATGLYQKKQRPATWSDKSCRLTLAGA